MRPKWIVAATALVAVGLSAWGCNSDTTAPRISLNQAEVTQWFSELDPMSAGGVGDAEGPINASISCPMGGSIGAVGSATTSTFHVTLTFSACETTSYTTGGSLRFAGSLSSSSFTETMSGTVTLTASGGRSGTCVVDLTLGFSFSDMTSTVSGTICGLDATTIVPTLSASWRARHQPLWNYRRR